MLKRLQNRFAPGRLLHHGQGKLYPGESLPRWALGCYWRTDGVPVWENPDLIADESRDYGTRRRMPIASSRLLAERLGVDPQCAQPAYEDVWYYLWNEQQLPVNLDPRESNLDDPEERHRLTQVFDHGLGQVVGYALPLRHNRRSASTGECRPRRWVSDRWFLRREHLFLLPGDSPVGFRLPLESLPWASEEDLEPFVELDPFAPRAPLPPRSPRPTRRQKISTVTATPRSGGGPDAGELRDHWAVGQSISGVIRTALCAEPRDGKLHVFLPPQELLEDYLELITAVEATAQRAEPAGDRRGLSPAHRSSAESFQHHARPRGDRGQHPPVAIVGRAGEADHDALRRGKADAAGHREIHARRPPHGHRRRQPRGPRRPDPGRQPGPAPARLAAQPGHLLAQSSLAVLSFLGPVRRPDSQAPRLDEARNDSLYEMEIAFRQIPDRGGCPALAG